MEHPPTGYSAYLSPHTHMPHAIGSMPSGQSSSQQRPHHAPVSHCLAAAGLLAQLVPIRRQHPSMGHTGGLPRGTWPLPVPINRSLCWSCQPPAAVQLPSWPSPGVAQPAARRRPHECLRAVVGHGGLHAPPPAAQGRGWRGAHSTPVALPVCVKHASAIAPARHARVCLTASHG